VKSFNKNGSTMLELIVMMAIMGIGISSMLWVVETWSYFAKDTEDNIKAINLAREWIEWVTTLRNTNWQRFSSDKINCWIVLDYKSNCIWSGSIVPTIWSGSYKLYIQNGLWYLSGITVNFTDIYWTDWNSYRQIYKSWLDDKWFYSQTGLTMYSSWCTSELQKNCITPFTREITINPISTGAIFVKSIVRWKWKRDREITIDATLTNWKSKF
jgi:type II secretory pathway pseudopilin PulG